MGSVLPGARVVVVDDVLASGATMHTAIQLVRQLGAEVVCVAVVTEMEGHGARVGLEGGGIPVVSLLHYEGK